MVARCKLGYLELGRIQLVHDYYFTRKGQQLQTFSYIRYSCGQRNEAPKVTSRRTIQCQVNVKYTNFTCMHVVCSNKPNTGLQWMCVQTLGIFPEFHWPQLNLSTATCETKNIAHACTHTHTPTHTHTCVHASTHAHTHLGTLELPIA